MSGAKRVTVDQGAWQQAQQAAARLRDVNRELPGMIESLRREQEAATNRITTQVRERQDAFERQLAGLSEQTKRIEAETSRRIRAKADQLRGQMRNALDRARQETRASLEEQEQRFQDELARERQDRLQESRALRDELQNVRQDRERALSAAASLAADSRRLRDAIEQNLPHQRFAPGRLADLSRRLELADGNIAQGFGESALPQTQELYLELSDLRAEVELRDQEWQMARMTASSAVTVLQEQIRLNSNLDVADEDGSPIEGVTLDVDFWSEGELAELRAAAAALADRVAAEDNPPRLADLQQIIDRDVPELDGKLTEIVARAQARQWASQVRANLAELVVTTLEETTGYSWEAGQAIYASGDQRRAFYSKLRHLDDSEIVVEVAPDEGGKSCVLRILSYDVGTPDEEERVRRAHAVVASLREQGLEVGVPTAEREAPDPQLTDFERLRQPAKQVRQPVATARTEPELG
jgi:hypothetical protein